MWTKRIAALVLGAALGISLGAFGSSASAATGDRPTNVAAVKAGERVLLHKDGTLTVAARLRCKPGWVAEEVSATLGQGEASASGFAVVTVPCDRRWHRVTFALGDSAGAFHPGRVTFNFLQFLVTNASSGDSAGAHDNGAHARLRLAC
jgi:hypothetical protein